MVGRMQWRMATVVVVIAFGAAAGALDGRGATVTAPAAAPEPGPRTFSFVAAGDWLPEHRVLDAAAAAAPPGIRYDHKPLLAPVRPIIESADVAICHMETPIGKPGALAGFVGRASTGTSLIAAPYELAGDLRRTGFDRCTTASNHSHDLGVDGIDSTLDALDAAGLSHTGTARSPDEARPDLIDVRGVRVGHVSFARNSNVGWPSDAWRIDRLRTADTARAAVTDLRSRGAEVVIVSLHVFVEMLPAPTAEDRAIVEAITADGDVDLVVIHGPHVVQPVERVNGATVFWSLGNFVSAMGTPSRGRYSDLRTLDGLLATGRFTERDDGRFDLEAFPVLTCQRLSSRVVFPGFAPSAVPITPDVDDDLVACRARSVPVVADLR